MTGETVTTGVVFEDVFDELFELVFELVFELMFELVFEFAFELVLFDFEKNEPKKPIAGVLLLLVDCLSDDLVVSEGTLEEALEGEPDLIVTLRPFESTTRALPAVFPLLSTVVALPVLVFTETGILDLLALSERLECHGKTSPLAHLAGLLCSRRKLLGGDLAPLFHLERLAKRAGLLNRGLNPF